MSKIKIKCFGLVIEIDANSPNLNLKSKGKLSFHEPNLRTASQDFKNTFQKYSLITFLVERIEPQDKSITDILNSTVQDIRDRVEKENNWGADAYTTNIEFTEQYIHFRDYFNNGLDDVYTEWFFKKTSNETYMMLKYSAISTSETYVLDLAKFILSHMTITLTK